jgi:hypothetical protein
MKPRCIYASSISGMEKRDYIAYTGPDDPDAFLWSGQPGIVIDVARDAAGAVWDVSVALVGGTPLSGLPSLFEAIDVATYESRGARVVAGLHPLRDSVIGPHIAMPGHEWPVRPRP